MVIITVNRVGQVLFAGTNGRVFNQICGVWR